MATRVGRWESSALCLLCNQDLLNGLVARKLARGNDMIGKNARCGILGFVCVVFALAANAGAQTRLENKEFRFSVRAPVGTVSCEEASGGHRHGFSFLLNPTPRGCKSSRKQPYIGLYGDYNVLNYKTPARSLRLLCPQSQRSSEPKDVLRLTFPGHASAACEKEEENGWIDVFVAALAGKWPDAGTSKAPYINYTAQLHTKRAKLRENMRTFRKVLAGVKIFADR